MKFKFKHLLVLPLLCLLLPLNVKAVSVPGPGTAGGGGSSEDITTPVQTAHYHEITDSSGEYTFQLECWSEFCDMELGVFTPKITALHSVNAIVAGSEEYNGVYYLPELEDIPIDLVSLCSDVTLKGGSGSDARHSFAYVYDGYYNAEVQLEQPQYDGYKSGTAKTSKRVWSSTDSSRLLNVVGYDMLLRSENYELDWNSETGNIDITYNTSLVGNSPLTADIIVMNLYKAMGLFEYDFDLAWGKDPATFGYNKTARLNGLNSSPLLQGITYLVEDVNVSEVKTYIAVTRTNPDLYWDRFTRDAICNGGQHTYTSTSSEIGSEVSVSEIYSRGSKLTGAQFCNLARAIMVLYGEKIPTEYELICAEQAYSIQFPQGRYTDEVYDSIMYLIAKGIVDPSEFDFDSEVTFADIEFVLLRIADKDSRIETIEYYNAKNPLADKGYTMAKDVTILDEAISVSVTDNTRNSQYDILVQVVSGVNTQPLVKGNIEDYTWNANGFSYSQGNIVITGIPEYDVTLVGVNNNYYCLQGIKKLKVPNCDELIEFYHFKAGTDTLGTDKLYLTTSVVNETFPWNYDSPYHLPCDEGVDGGVWMYNSNTREFEHHKFSEMNCSTDFIDSESVQLSGQLASDKIVVVLAPAAYMTSDFLLGASVDGFNFTNVAVTGYHSANEIGNGVSCSTSDYPANSIDYIRMEFNCGSDVTLITNSTFLRELNARSSNGDISTMTVPGFYRSSTNTLLVSTDYLMEKGCLTGIKELANDQGYVLLNSGYGVNVTLSNQFGYIMVGNTLYPADGTDLYVKEGDTLYVNYKACIGWTGDCLVLPGNTDRVVVQPRRTGLIQPGGVSQYVNYDTIDIYSFFPYATTSVLETTQYSDIYRLNMINKGLSLSGNYVLSPYLLVMADDNDKDYLFVYHRRNSKVNGSVVDSDAQANDESARVKFFELTGVNLEYSEDFYVYMYTLNRDGTNMPAGLKLLTQDTNTTYTSGATATLGYVYEVQECSSVIAAIQEYATGNSMTYALPFAKYQSGNSYKYYDLNVNTYKKDSTSDTEDVGKMPYSMSFSSNSNKVTIVNHLGGITRLNSETLDLNNVVLCAAPAGIWGQLQLIGQSKLSELRSSMCAMYYGTQYVTKNDDGIVIENRRTSIDSDSLAFCTYYGSYGSSVYVSYAKESTIGPFVDLQSVEDTISSAIEDPMATIDWGQYKFTRLMESADKWSSILLIFILNILPRICMLMFFIIILLALITKFKPWQMFNQRCFDVYEFLSFGHVNVDTINYKRVIFTSMIALALFYMIMDGTLWNVIMWCIKGVLYLSQH